MLPNPGFRRGALLNQSRNARSETKLKAADAGLGNYRNFRRIRGKSNIGTRDIAMAEKRSFALKARQKDKSTIIRRESSPVRGDENQS
jgi:hypothetical protein